MNKPELRPAQNTIIDPAVEDLNRWGKRQVTIETSMEMAIDITSALQLALRHPSMAEDGGGSRTGQSVRRFLDAFIDAIPEDYPQLKALLKMGFDPKHDQP